MVSALPLSVLLLLSAGCIISHAGSVADDELHYIHVTTGSLQADSVCHGFKVDPLANLTNWAPLSRLYGPCSAKPEAAAPSVADMLRWDQHRADYIRAKLTGGDEVPQDDNNPPVVNASTTIVYTDNVLHSNLGTPPNGSPAHPNGTLLGIDMGATGGRRELAGVKQTMVIDTASDVPWVQCAPCPVPPCHPQTDVLYDPARSGSSATFSCASPTCRQLGPFFNGCSGDTQCQYRVRYPDGSATAGTYVSDVLALTPAAVVPRFRFGCSHGEVGSFNNQTSGIMALGAGPQSLVSQVAAEYGDVFSYCFPATASRKGFFTLGGARRATSSAGFAVTPMLRSDRAPTLYMVALRAVAVAGRRLGVPPAAFAAGAVMDSRAVVTRLPPAAYAALRAAFADAMRMYRRAPPRGQLDTCFDFTGVAGGGGVRLPRVALVFDGEAIVELDPSGILFDGCLAFASTGDDRVPGIIGNVQQRTLEVLYDVAGGAVGFRGGAC
ncbi:hypothetical protein ACP4OV_005449 [Aristida adscensionis]